MLCACLVCIPWRICHFTFGTYSDYSFIHIYLSYTIYIYSSVVCCCWNEHTENDCMHRVCCARVQRCRCRHGFWVLIKEQHLCHCDSHTHRRMAHACMKCTRYAVTKCIMLQQFLSRYPSIQLFAWWTMNNMTIAATAVAVASEPPDTNGRKFTNKFRHIIPCAISINHGCCPQISLRFRCSFSATACMENS